MHPSTGYASNANLTALAKVASSNLPPNFTIKRICPSLYFSSEYPTKSGVVTGILLGIRFLFRVNRPFVSIYFSLSSLFLKILLTKRTIGMLTNRAVGKATTTPISQFRVNIRRKASVHPAAIDTIVNDITLTRTNTMKTVTRIDIRLLCCRTINPHLTCHGNVLSFSDVTEICEI